MKHSIYKYNNPLALIIVVFAEYLFFSILAFYQAHLNIPIIGLQFFLSSPPIAVILVILFFYLLQRSLWKTTVIFATLIQQ